MYEIKDPVHLPPDTHQALAEVARAAGRPVDDMVNEAVQVYLVEEHEDLADALAARDEPVMPFEQYVAELRDSGGL